MKKETGMGIIAIILIILSIIALCFGAYYFVSNFMKKEKNVDIKANMLVIKGKAKVLEETSKVNNNEEGLKGKKLSEMQEDHIISEFLKKNIIYNTKLENYYALRNEDLKEMELDIQNEKDSYYIVNYETEEVYITKGYVNEENSSTIYKLE